MFCVIGAFDDIVDLFVVCMLRVMVLGIVVCREKFLILVGFVLM